jgi:2-dehydro-3-deoxygluconokinase
MNKKNNKIVTFGEIMLRMSPSLLGERIVKAIDFTIEPGGSESNVAVALAKLGNETVFVSKLPVSNISEKIMRYLKSYSVDTSYIIFGGKRVGLYWTEKGIGPRASQVIYDREYSSFSNIKYTDFDWNGIFKSAYWFHTSGICPALSDDVYKTLKKCMREIKRNIMVSIDINYRNKLWNWVNKKPSSIHRVMWDFCSRANLITANESDLSNALGLKGKTKKGDYELMAQECFKQLPNLNYIAINLRESFSASRNKWSGVLFVREKGKITMFKGPEIMITDIVDRIGSGDSFTAGIIHGIINCGRDFQRIVNFAVGLSALKHTIRGDASQFTSEDVENLFDNPGSKILR